MERLQRTMAVRLVSMEKRQQEEQSAVLASLQSRVDTLHVLVKNLAGHVARLEQEYVMITASLRSGESRFDLLEAQRLGERISALEARWNRLPRQTHR